MCYTYCTEASFENTGPPPSVAELNPRTMSRQPPAQQSRDSGNEGARRRNLCFCNGPLTKISFCCRNCSQVDNPEVCSFYTVPIWPLNLVGVVWELYGRLATCKLPACNGPLILVIQNQGFSRRFLHYFSPSHKFTSSPILTCGAVTLQGFIQIRIVCRDVASVIANLVVPDS